MQSTTFKTREDARRDFQQKHASEYPTHFTSEPASRPSYIPQRTQVGGQSVVVVYDRRYGGYGSFYGNSWHAYNPLMDYLILDSLLNQRGYSVAPVSQPGVIAPVAVYASPWQGVIVVLVFVAISAIVVCVLIWIFGERL